MKPRIEQKLKDNIGRVRNMVKIYDDHLKGSGSGRRGHLQTDVLRAATVFLHASLEDLLRSLSYWKLPLADRETIDKVPIVGSNGSSPKKFLLGELVEHRNKKIDELIKESVDEYLERSNYNNTGEIAALMPAIGVQVKNISAEFKILEELMARRHQIVHRADIDESGGAGNHKVKSIGVTQVHKWIESVESFGITLLDEFDE